VINPLEFRFSQLFLIAAIGSNHDESYFIDKSNYFQYFARICKNSLPIHLIIYKLVLLLRQT